MKKYNYDNEKNSSRDSNSVTKISEHDLSWLLANSGTATGKILKWEYAQGYNISNREVKRQLRRYANSDYKNL